MANRSNLIVKLYAVSNSLSLFLYREVPNPTEQFPALRERPDWLLVDNVRQEIKNHLPLR